MSGHLKINQTCRKGIIWNSGANGLRVLACVLVILHHGFQLYHPTSNILKKITSVFLMGDSGVSVFFVLSGYLLSIPFWKSWHEEEQIPSLKSYFFRRIIRIAPAFWINLTICYFIEKSLFPNMDGLQLRYIFGMTFLSGISWRFLFPVEINGPLWSISFEVFSYALFAIFSIFWFRTQKPRTFGNAVRFWLIIAVIVAILHSSLLISLPHASSEYGWQNGLVNGARNWWPPFNPVGFFLFFLTGVLASGVHFRFSKSTFFQIPESQILCDIIVTLLLLVFALLLWFRRDFQQNFIGIPPLPYLFPLLPIISGAVLIFVPLSRIWQRICELQIISHLAIISYGIYLWHHLVMELIIRRTGHENGFSNPSQWLIFMIVSIVISIFISTLSWTLIEKPIVNWGSKFLKRAYD